MHNNVLLLLVLNLSFSRECLICHRLGMKLDRTPMNMFKEDNMSVFAEQWGRQTDNSILKSKYQDDSIETCYNCWYTLPRHNL